FITAIGNDQEGKNLKTALERVNVKVLHPMSNGTQPRYLAIHDSRGDMIIAVSDMELLQSITSDYINQVDILKDYKHLVLDTNVSDEVIKYIFENFNGKIYVDAISTTKALKIKPYLNKIYLLKCNILEAKALGGKLEGKELLEKLKSFGTQNIVITSGAGNILYQAHDDSGTVKVDKIKNIVNTTGAGDAMASGIIYGMINNLYLKESIEIGKKLSKLSLMSKDAVSSEISKNLGLK
ncbi:MAG TPA: hypothetical protein GXZ48_00865, partial [Acholeplasmataceae bacterium]|nr:hypothetical protein [Acholeplasmataceae bacterium]